MENGGTAFARLVASGLVGEAKKSGWLKRQLGLADIRLPELQEYINEQVNTWTLDNRAAVQTPVWCYGESDLPDWSVADSAGGTLDSLAGQHSPDTEKNVKDQLDKVAELWGEFDKWAEEEKYLNDPRGWADIQARLLRLEQLAIAGNAYKETYQIEYNPLYSLLVEGKQPSTAEAASQAATAAPDPSADRVPREHLMSSLPLITLVGSEHAEKLSPAKSANEGTVDPAGKQPAEIELSYPRLLENAKSLFAAGNSPVREDVSKLLGQMDKSRPGTCAFDPVEIAFARMIKDCAMARRNGTWEATSQAAIGKSLKCRFLAEQAAAPPDTRAVAWISKQVELADADRRKADDLLMLFDAERESPEELNKLLDSATGRYEAAYGLGELVSEAFHVQDRSQAQLVGLAYWVLRRPQEKGTDRRASLQGVLQLIRDTHQLSDILSHPLSDWTPESEQFRTLQEEIARLAKSIDEGRKKLWTEYWKYVSEMEGGDKNADALQRCAVVLSAPCGGGASKTFDERSADTSRSAILRRYRELLFAKKESVQRVPPSPDSLLADIASCGVHPVAAILKIQAVVSPESGTGGLAWEKAKEEQAIRKQLSELIDRDVTDSTVQGLKELGNLSSADPISTASMYLQNAEQRCASHSSACRPGLRLTIGPESA